MDIAYPGILSTMSLYYYLVAPTVIAQQSHSAFTYHSEEALGVGQLVRVPLGKKKANGVVLQRAKKPAFKTRPIDSAFAMTLPPQLLKTAHWMSSFYATPLPVVLQTILPSGLHKQRRASHVVPHSNKRERNDKPLSADQQKALKNILAQDSLLHVLHGVTSSGKTRVYIELAKHAVNNLQSVIVLIPEIALTSQIIAEFQNHFAAVFVTHSDMTESQRHKVWNDIQHSTTPCVVIGPRSALFAPIHTLGFIIMDEFHEPGFKQDTSPKYNSLVVASVLAKQHNAKVVAGSATPNVSDLHILQQKKASLHSLPTTVNQHTPPSIQLIDMKQKAPFKKNRWLSTPMIDMIEKTLLQKKQVLLFHNRRGTASAALCSNCGFVAQCPHCFIPFTLHDDQSILKCHTCDRQQPIPLACPECQQPDIRFKGFGTKRIEQEVKRMFPGVHAVRFDADNKKGQRLSDQYQAIYDGTIQILIGTQILAKGLDLPHLESVGVVSADSSLYLPDYTAAERTFQLLYQVIGRVGRHSHSGQVVVQTYTPTHYAITTAIERDYHSFYKQEVDFRQQGNYPPFCYLLKLTTSYTSQRKAEEAAQKLLDTLKATFSKLEYLGPAPAFYERRGDQYRWQIIIKSPSRPTLQKILEHVPARWQADLDPGNLL